MEDEEGGGEKQRLVHRLPLSHVPPRSGSHTRLRAGWREQEDDEGEGGGGRGCWTEVNVS